MRTTRNLSNDCGMRKVKKKKKSHSYLVGLSCFLFIVSCFRTLRDCHLYIIALLLGSMLVLFCEGVDWINLAQDRDS